MLSFACIAFDVPTVRFEYILAHNGWRFATIYLWNRCFD